MRNPIACLAVAFLATSASLHAQNTWYVDDDGVPPGSGTQQDPYTSIQYAIAQVTTVEGDTVLVMGGQYYETIDFGSKGLTISCPDGRDNTFFYPTGSQDRAVVGHDADIIIRSMTFAEPSPSLARGLAGFANCGVEIEDCVITGFQPGTSEGLVRFTDCAVVIVASEFTLIDGQWPVKAVGGTVQLTGSRFYANSCGTGCYYWNGGGLAITNASCEVLGCEFSAIGSTENGGAIKAEGLGVVVRGSLFSNCFAGWAEESAYAGAILCGSLDVSDTKFSGCGSTNAAGAISSGSVIARNCEFIGNSTGWWYGFNGGAISAGIVDIEGCTFRANKALPYGPYTWDSVVGGALAIGGGSIRKSIFESNEATGGGAVKCGAAEFVDCLFLGNLARDYGGAIQGSQASAVRCTFVGNHAGMDGGAVLGVDLEHCTLVQDSGSPPPLVGE